MTNTNAAVNEVRYLMAHNFLSLLLAQGKITADEFNIVHRFVVEKYQPKLPIV